MVARQAVLLTPPGNGNCPLWSYPYTGTLPRLISFLSHSYENTGGVGVFFPFRDAPTCRRSDVPTFPCPPKSFTCNTYASPRKCCKQKTYGTAKFFRHNTYKKTGGGSRMLALPTKFSPFTHVPQGSRCLSRKR